MGEQPCVTIETTSPRPEIKVAHPPVSWISSSWNWKVRVLATSLFEPPPSTGMNRLTPSASSIPFLTAV
jgi:hypothetical protein